MTDIKLCLKHNKGCYPPSSFTRGFMQKHKLNVGDVIEEPLKSADSTFHKVTVTKCKFPECL